MIRYEDLESAIGANWWDVDPNLQQVVSRLMDPADQEWCIPELRRFGALCGGDIAARAEVTDRNGPQLVQWDRDGERVDRIVHHPGALATRRDLWEFGVSGPRLRLEAARRARAYPPVLQLALHTMLAQAETGMLCAVGMTEGVVLLIERHATPELAARLMPRLRAPRWEDAWDGAMFLTEKTGGSDLGTVTTRARPQPGGGGGWRLDGAKWFCSNVDAQLIATLARPEGMPDGIKGLALFLVPQQRADGTRNGLVVRRLKDKLGTRAVPTAEVDFADAEAWLLAHGGDAYDGRGINRMMEMVNVSRLGVAAMGLGIMRRAFFESCIFAARRSAFGRRLDAQPMMREELVQMVVELEAATALLYASVTGGDALGRILIPLAKLRAARGGLELATRAVEVHGGNGYIETWPVARQLRDAQCHTLWEGTEHVICLDVLRALKEADAREALFDRLARPAHEGAPALSAIRRKIVENVKDVKSTMVFLADAPRDLRDARAKRFGPWLADVVQAALLLEEAEWALARGDGRKALVARLFCERRLDPGRGATEVTSTDATALVHFDVLTRYGVLPPSALV